VFKNAKDALLKFELPNCLQLMLEDRINAGEINEVASFLREFFIGNKLTDKYLDVFRMVLGDDAVLEIINRNITSPSSIHPIVKLSAIFGEGAFHTPQFLDSLVWNRDGELPVHLVRFNQIGFDETKLPLLADYLMANLDPATKIHKSVGGVAYVADLAKMAVRMNRGLEVIEALTTNLAGFTNLVKPSRSEAINELHRLGGEAGWQVSKTRAFTLLLDVVEIVGLKALHDLAPDVNARVLGEFMDTKKTDLTEQQIIKLFPQARGHILGHALGL
jgi:hypothetical protein